MKIKVLRNYGGMNTNERRILPAIYDSNDEALFGLAQYLVDNGHAIVIEADAPVKRVRADKTVTPDDVDDNVVTDDTIEFDRLSAEYEALAGRKPSSNIKLETLRDRVSEMQSEG